MKHEYQQQLLEPVFNGKSKILILGTFPSVKSRELNFYYSHPQNRFWRVVAAVIGSKVPITTDEKKRMLLTNGIALWDVIQSCDIAGSSDSSIRNVVPADLSVILDRCDIRRIYANGARAKKLYEQYTQHQTGMPITGLPSTSPANAAFSLEKLIYSWEQIAGLLK